MRKRAALRAALGLLTASCLWGCQSPPQSDLPTCGPPYWERMAARLEAITVLEERGRLGIISDDYRGSLNYRYAGRGDTRELQLLSPFGNPVASLGVTGGRGRLRLGDDETEVPDLRAAMRQALRLDLDPDSLQRLLLGLPDTVTARGDDGRVRAGDCGACHVRYDAYAPVGDLALPAAMELSCGRTQVKIRVRSVDRAE